MWRIPRNIKLRPWLTSCVSIQIELEFSDFDQHWAKNRLCSQHSQDPNHTGQSFKEFTGRVNSSPDLPLVSAYKLNSTIASFFVDRAFTILNCVITPVTIVKIFQEVFTRALAYLACHRLSLENWHGRVCAFYPHVRWIHHSYKSPTKLFSLRNIEAIMSQHCGLDYRWGCFYRQKNKQEWQRNPKTMHLCRALTGSRQHP